MAVMAAMAARQVMVRNERTVVGRIWSLYFDADSAEESRRRSVAATVKEALGVVEGDGSDGDDGGDGR